MILIHLPVSRRHRHRIDLQITSSFRHTNTQNGDQGADINAQTACGDQDRKGIQQDSHKGLEEAEHGAVQLGLLQGLVKQLEEYSA